MADNLLSLSDSLDKIVERHRTALSKNIEKRRQEMELDNIEHLALYELLGFSREEGRKVDLYQNIGRFIYKYAGSLIEGATVAVLQATKPGRSLRIPNTISKNPKTFQIDYLVDTDNKAHEIKWRDATTDGDHIRKEHDKVQCIVAAKMIPVRIMYYMPNRQQAIQIQQKVIANYKTLGEVYVGKAAWQYIQEYAGFDLYAYFEQKTRDLRL